MQHSSGFTKIAEEAKKNIKEIDLASLEKLKTTNPHFYLVDVREKEEFDNGFIPGAIHLSKGVIERDIEKTIPAKNAQIVLYCGGGSRSALAAENLQRMGYTNVFSLIGGYRGACGV
ncbi:MAG TPA: rhodanese-like domain-containing protein [Gammaproteobacteria bacterium]|nr:rhodanese-like domain-containing protein [Gammaproteobacteria bacterium]